MNEILKFIILNFWKFAGAMAGFSLGLLLVIFGLWKTLFVILVMVLGYMLGKWKDEGLSFNAMFKNIMSSMHVDKWR
ncbi:MAG: DUF2273 domain-containing protein [Spirochaetia bacterium]|nr:DUF2273 domain-containing protein [Spirochaetia bacterium]